MESYNNYDYTPVSESRADTYQQYVMNVFVTMLAGLVVTAVISWLMYRSILSGGAVYRILVNGGTIAIFAPFILQLVITFALVAGLRKFSLGTVTVLFYLYAALTGVTFSVIFLAYDIGTITLAFGYTALMFGACVFCARFLKVDMTKFGGILLGALIALVIASVAAIFIPALRDSLILTYAGIVIFALYTAYDMKKLKDYYYAADFEGTEMSRKYGIYGAFQLYLDFINLFIRILQLISRNRRN